MSMETVKEPSSSRATLARVAAEASVSLSTVSKVLNGRSGISEATRSKVEDLLHSHGYNRRGATQTAPLIELVMSQMDMWAVEIIRGVEKVARESGMSVVLTESGDRHSPGPEWVEGVLQRHPLGVILVFSDLSPENKKQLRTRDIPFVVIDPAGDPASDVASIGSANWSGGVLAAKHLIDMGHRDIAMITGPDDMMCSRARLSGFRSAMEGAGLPIREELIVSGQFQLEDGVVRGAELLALTNPPTAIFAGNDLQAFGVYEAARAKGLTIPGDLSVVGYDDLQMAGWLGPPLTTVRQPLTEMAEQATHLVLSMADRGPNEPLRIELATSLVVRDSTRRLL
jgi:LacI family xylobiose transport system transcriptional regulator